MLWFIVWNAVKKMTSHINTTDYYAVVPLGGSWTSTSPGPTGGGYGCCWAVAAYEGWTNAAGIAGWPGWPGWPYPTAAWAGYPAGGYPAGEYPPGGYPPGGYPPGGYCGTCWYPGGTWPGFWLYPGWAPCICTCTHEQQTVRVQFIGLNHNHTLQISTKYYKNCCDKNSTSLNVGLAQPLLQVNTVTLLRPGERGLRPGSARPRHRVSMPRPNNTGCGQPEHGTWWHIQQ